MCHGSFILLWQWQLKQDSKCAQQRCAVWVTHTYASMTWKNADSIPAYCDHPHNPCTILQCRATAINTKGDIHTCEMALVSSMICWSSWSLTIVTIVAVLWPCYTCHITPDTQRVHELLTSNKLLSYCFPLLYYRINPFTKIATKIKI